MGNYNIRTDMQAGDSGHIAWGTSVGEAVNDLDARVAAIEPGAVSYTHLRAHET